MPLRNETLYEPVPSLTFDLTPPTIPEQIGIVYWDATDNTIAVKLVVGDNPVTLQIGQETQAYVWNNTGVDIANGAAGYANGALAYRPTVALARANSILTSLVHGLSTMPIPKNTQGFATLRGLVRGYDTQTPGWAEGELLYLSDTVAGGLQNTPPTAGFNVVVGRVLRVHPTDGMIFVEPRPIPAFGDLVGGNYTQWEFDGTMEAVGNAKTWRDELGILIGSRLTSPSSDIVENVPEGTLTFKATARYPTDYVVKTYQLNHDWDNGGIGYHIHWFQASSASANWLAAYRWQVNGQAKETAWTNIPMSTQAYVYSAGTLVQINAMAAYITPPATVTVSDFFQVKVYRDYTNASGLFAGAETNGLDIDALASDVHRQSNTIGSREEYVK
jgi:hypothetical protein